MSLCESSRDVKWRCVYEVSYGSETVVVCWHSYPLTHSLTHSLTDVNRMLPAPVHKYESHADEDEAATEPTVTAP